MDRMSGESFPRAALAVSRRRRTCRHGAPRCCLGYILPVFLSLATSISSALVTLSDPQTLPWVHVDVFYVPPKSSLIPDPWTDPAEASNTQVGRVALGVTEFQACEIPIDLPLLPKLPTECINFDYPSETKLAKASTLTKDLLLAASITSFIACIPLLTMHLSLIVKAVIFAIVSGMCLAPTIYWLETAQWTSKHFVPEIWLNLIHSIIGSSVLGSISNEAATLFPVITVPDPKDFLPSYKVSGKVAIGAMVPLACGLVCVFMALFYSLRFCCCCCCERKRDEDIGSTIYIVVPTYERVSDEAEDD